MQNKGHNHMQTDAVSFSAGRERSMAYTIYMKRFAFALLFTGIVALPGAFALAQVLPSPVSVTASPSAPEPGETVTIHAATPLFEPSSAVFQWTVGGVYRSDLSGTGRGSGLMTSLRKGARSFRKCMPVAASPWATSTTTASSIWR